MWVIRFKIKHDCILGNRCQEFGVTLQSVNFSVVKKGKRTITSSMHLMSGNKKDIDKFISDLKEDKEVIKVERKGDMFFLLEKAKEKAVGFHTPKIIFVKPIIMLPDGNEFWEVASWEKEELAGFLNKVKKVIKDFELVSFVERPINNVFFPRLMPNLTPSQKRALEISIESGYFSSPRKTTMRSLAKSMDISVATFQEHLSKAEEKIMPNIFHYTQ